MKKVFVIILHYKGKKLTYQCLKSLEEVKTKGFELKIIVVDNHSPEPIDSFKKEFTQIDFIKSGRNLGFVLGNNLGIKKALDQQADYVLLLNNDTKVDKDFLVELIKVAQKDPLIGIVAPKIYFAPGYEYHQTRYKTSDQGKVFWYAGGLIDWKNILASHRGVDEVDQGQYNQLVETDFASGCALLVKRKVLDKIGLLDQRYFLYLEDVEFCQRAKKNGFKIVYAPLAKIWHFNASSSQVGGELHDYFITRNRLLFGLKYASWRTKLALLRESIKLRLRGRAWQKAGIRDFYLAKFGKGSWHDQK